MVHTRDPGSVEAGRTGVQEHPQLQVSLRSACATRDPTNTEQEINSTFVHLVNIVLVSGAGLRVLGSI